jgi:NhaP-type Na+/H+ or K+/H+ antiporter
MLYTVFGLGVGLLFRDYLTLSFGDPIVEVIATLTLVLVLGTDASRIKFRPPYRHYVLPLRLLAIGLPLTIALGAVVAVALFGGQLGIWEAAVLAVILAPTDASLGQSVVNNPRVPARIRQALNIESGLNDGIAMPFLILTLSVVISSENQLGSGFYLLLTLQQIVFGLIAGLLIGYLAARYIRWGHDSGWMSNRFQKISWLAFILIAYGAAVLVGGNGFIAAFVFGITSARFVSVNEMQKLDDFAEVENALLMLLTYILFGMVMLLPALQRVNATILLYALLSLTLVRMLPVAISLLGAKLRPVSVLFLGWFGPRGIASILYVLAVVETEELAAKDTIYAVVMTTVFLSVLAHGITATPLSDWYGRRIAALDKKGAADSETLPVPEMPTRTGALPVASTSSSPGGL